MKKTLVAAASVATIMLAPTAASAQALCAVGVIIAAIHIGAQENRELTEKEAFTCGASYVLEKHQAQADDAAAAKAKPAAVKKRAKKQKSAGAATSE